jgi:predicted unusual protein kinase regulating ubiquinone biosynthesis (AarF/ABC1/UbiB family)
VTSAQERRLIHLRLRARDTAKLLGRFFAAFTVFGRVFLSYLVQLFFDYVTQGQSPWVDRRWKRVHERNAKRLYRGIVRLRGVYIKMGQVLSIMGNLLPRAYSRELEGLQDQVPPAPWRDIEQAIAESLGREPSEVFAELDPKPLAAASLGQVHRARLRNIDGTPGEIVAVKVLYPNVKDIIAVDLRVLEIAVRVYKLFMPMGGLEKVVDQLRDLLARETNFLHEARCLERLAANLKGEPDVLFPTVHWGLTSSTVLVMSFMEGVKISRKDELAKMGVDPEQIARRLVELFYKQLFIDRLFHADPHPGNFLVQQNGKLVFLDFGAVSEVHDALLDGAFKVLQGMFMRNDQLVMQGIDQMGFVSKSGDRALLERTVKQYFEKLLKLNIQDFGRIRPEQLAELDPGLERDELRELMKSVEYPDGWFYVERSAVILFGLAAHLAPRMNTVMVGMPYVMQRLAAVA